MELQGKIIQTLPEQSGTSKLGNQWYKRSFVLETNDKFPRKVCFDMFNDNARACQAKVGDYVTAHIDIESRDYNGRWYTSVSAYKVELNNTAPTAAEQEMPQATQPQPIPMTSNEPENDGGLPF